MVSPHFTVFLVLALIFVFFLCLSLSFLSFCLSDFLGFTYVYYIRHINSAHLWVLRECFVRSPLLEFVWCCSHSQTEVMSAWKEDHKGTLHHIKGLSYEHDLSLLMLNLITWLKECLAGFSTVKLLFSPSHILFIGNKSLNPNYT